jgi:DNA-directed RNA polymerase beta' subunit
MGPVDPKTVCVTCGLAMRDCPGHMGHLELYVKVYNPLTFATVFQILRVKCFTCHQCVQWPAFASPLHAVCVHGGRRVTSPFPRGQLLYDNGDMNSRC